MNQNSIREQFTETMLEVGREDDRLVVLVGDISHFKLQPFARECPGRYYNVGICEPTIISMAAVLAKVGMHPVAHTIAPFILERAYEQIKLDFCYQRLGGNIITVGSAFDYSNLGCTHHCYQDAGLLKSLAGVEITFPGSNSEFDTLFRQRYQNDRLTLYRIPYHNHGVDFSPQDIEFGKGIRLTGGEDLTVIVTGPQLKNVLSAQETLKSAGWSPEIIYLHTLWPLDTELIIESIKKTRRVLIIEEHVRAGGLGADVLYLTREIEGVEYSFLCLPDEFLREYGSYLDQCERVGLTPEGVVARVRQDFKRKAFV